MASALVLTFSADSLASCLIGFEQGKDASPSVSSPMLESVQGIVQSAHTSGDSKIDMGCNGQLRRSEEASLPLEQELSIHPGRPLRPLRSRMAHRVSCVMGRCSSVMSTTISRRVYWASLSTSSRESRSVSISHLTSDEIVILETVVKGKAGVSTEGHSMATNPRMTRNATPNRRIFFHAHDAPGKAPSRALTSILYD